MEPEEIDTPSSLYINDQPFEGIGEIELEPLPTVADSMTLELTLTPKEAAEIVEAIRPICNKAFECARQAIRQFVDIVAESFEKLRKTTRMSVDMLVDDMLYRANDNPKWWHLYKHAKKARTRKKYRRLLMKQLLSKLEAVRKSQEVNT